MQFRIRTLMGLVVSASILLAAWHLIPRGRFVLIEYMLMFSVIALPLNFRNRSRPGSWSLRQWSAYFAYLVVFGIVLGLLFSYLAWDLHLVERMATWPG